ncbi:MAG: hypothetical protein JOZ61_01585 [Verrucomicrobia bacterium]|nr:hypothetical protein [Verrucomicrobiota bacterium]
MNQSLKDRTRFHGTNMGLSPHVGHFNAHALAIIQRKRLNEYSGGSVWSGVECIHAA